MKKSEIYVPFITQIVLYVFQFIVLPLFVEVFSSGTDEVMMITAIFSGLISEMFFRTSIKMRLLSSLLYFLLVMAYHPGPYDIDTVAFVPPVIIIVIITLEVLLMQLIFSGIVKLFRKIIKRNK